MATTPDAPPAMRIIVTLLPDEAVVPDMYIAYKGHLIGVCCDECVETFNETPQKFMTALGLGGEKPPGGAKN